MIILDPLNELAYALKVGDQKGAIAIIRSTINNGKFKSEWARIAWEGWLKALESNSRDSLIFQLMNGLSPEVVDKYLKNFKNYMRTIPQRDPQKRDFARHFIGSWVGVLKAFKDTDLTSEDLAKRSENLKKFRVEVTGEEEPS
ncbi:MAG: hypothetical protein Q6352_000965 [Candidatus Freyrarchaeum guaymaensis]|nr:hypothetical protein [Candidatus Sigynarchaeota archaeon]